MSLTLTLRCILTGVVVDTAFVELLLFLPIQHPGLYWDKFSLFC